MKRFEARRHVRVKLTELEAEAVLEACDAFLEAERDRSGGLNSNVSRAMRKIAAGLVSSGAVKVKGSVPR